MHSTSGLPLPSTCCGNDSDGESTDDRRRRPDEPVSTWMLSIVWQLVVLPGAQTVTLIKARLTIPSGPALTLIGWVFCATGGGVPPPPPPPSPPRPHSASPTRSMATMASRRIGVHRLGSRQR